MLSLVLLKLTSFYECSLSFKDSVYLMEVSGHLRLFVKSERKMC